MKVTIADRDADVLSGKGVTAARSKNAFRKSLAGRSAEAA